MSDSKTDSTQLDGLDKETSGFDETGGSGSDKAKSKSRKAKAKTGATDKTSGRDKNDTGSVGGFSSVHRVWPD